MVPIRMTQKHFHSIEIFRLTLEKYKVAKLHALIQEVKPVHIFFYIIINIVKSFSLKSSDKISL